MNRTDCLCLLILTKSKSNCALWTRLLASNARELSGHHDIAGEQWYMTWVDNKAESTLELASLRRPRAGDCKKGNKIPTSLVQSDGIRPSISFPEAQEVDGTLSIWTLNGWSDLHISSEPQAEAMESYDCVFSFVLNPNPNPIARGQWL